MCVNDATNRFYMQFYLYKGPRLNINLTKNLKVFILLLKLTRPEVATTFKLSFILNLVQILVARKTDI